MACQELMPFLLQNHSVHCCSVSAWLPRWKRIHWRQNDGRRAWGWRGRWERLWRKSLVQRVPWVWPPWWSGSCFIGSVSPSPTVIRIKLAVMLKGAIWLEMEAINGRAEQCSPDVCIHQPRPSPDSQQFLWFWYFHETLSWVSLIIISAMFNFSFELSLG